MSRPAAIVIERRFAPPGPAADAALARAMELILAEARRIEQEAAQSVANRGAWAISPQEKTP